MDEKNFSCCKCIKKTVVSFDDQNNNVESEFGLFDCLRN